LIPQKILRLARQAMSSSEFRKKFHVADFWGETRWYPPQRRFFSLGAKHHQRLIRGANQSGKSAAAGYEFALHCTRTGGTAGELINQESARLGRGAGARAG
jgi:hypothetical protein